MNPRAWAFTAMTCALLLGAPTSLADEGEEEDGGILPSLSHGYLFDPDDLEDGCTSMLRATFVSFAGTIYETDIGEETSIAYVDGEHHTTVRTATEYVRLLLGPLGEELSEVVDVVESVETFEEATVVDGVLHVEWERDLIVWERVERTIAVPLPAEGEVTYADSDVVSSCEEDDHLSIDFPVHSAGHDVYWAEWYYEPYAPETPEPEWIYDRIDHTFTEGVDESENATYDEYQHAHCACPDEVAHATAEYVAGLHPVIEETIEEIRTVFVDDDEDEEESKEASGEDTEDADGFALRSLQAAPMAAKASAGGVGLAGLLGTALVALRRR